MIEIDKDKIYQLFYLILNIISRYKDLHNDPCG